MMAEIMGKATGYCKGRGGSMHISSKNLNHLGANGIVGGGIPIATGAGMGIKVKGTDQVVVVFFSDGASNNGVFAESLNLAGIYKLPVIYLLENNHYAVSTPIECATGCCDLAGRGPVYGVPGICVDGNDAVAVYHETLRAVERARRGEGPTLIEAKTYRHGGHHVNDPGLYMDPDIMARWKARDPLILMRRAAGDDARVAAIEAQVNAELEAAVEFAKNSPEPVVDEFLTDVEDS
jgi:TPP-dependent pyruvate/acetoin dehydrogenase alpha subunit